MSVDDQDIREFYSRPAAMTSLGEHTPLVKALPGDPGALADVLHGLVIHEHMTGGYGVTLADADRWSVHVRPADRLGDDLAALFDHRAEVTLAPDDNLPELRTLYSDERLRVPATVRNAVRNREEPV